MRHATLVFLTTPTELLLCLKKRGFGASKWNGPGGKVEPGETNTEAAIREVKEEIGVDIRAEDLISCGTLDFFFENKPAWDQTVSIFYTTRWTGTPTESEEMQPAWFSHEAIPYHEMWVADTYWLPYVLHRRDFTGAFTFSADGANLISHTLTTTS